MTTTMGCCHLGEHLSNWLLKSTHHFSFWLSDHSTLCTTERGGKKGGGLELTSRVQLAGTQKVGSIEQGGCI